MPRSDRTRSTRSQPGSARATLEPLECRRLCAAGDLDPSFSGDGAAVVSVAGTGFLINDMAVQADGKVVLAGKRGANPAVARLNADGTVDATFAQGGVFEFTSAYSPTIGDARSVAIQDDGKIVVAGADGERNDFAVARFLPNGSRDFTFASYGILSTDVRGETSRAADVTVQRDGKVVVVGQSWESDFLGLTADVDFVVVRYNADGSRDTTFDQDGIVIVGFGGEEEANAVAVDYNGTPETNPYYGTILVAGGGVVGSGSKFLAARLMPAGHLDTRFGGTGKFSAAFAGYADPVGVVPQPGGRFVLGGAVGPSGSQDFAMVRFTPGGAPDTTFGAAGTGRVQTTFGGNDWVVAFAPGDEGSLLAGNASQNGLAAARYTPDGLPDTRFGGDGVVKTDFGISFGSHPAVAVAAAPGNRILVAGWMGRVACYEDVPMGVRSPWSQTPVFEARTATATSLLTADDTSVPSVRF